MTLVDVITHFDTDERCRELLVRLRWPNGTECPRCKMPAVELATAKQLFYCKGCDYQFTVTSGTVFNDSHLPLQKWFLATLLLCESRKGHSANQMKRELGVSYKTAWYLCHRIRYAMTEVHKMLDGTIEIDETYIGGKRRGMMGGTAKKSKEVVIGIVQRGGALKFIHVKDATTKAIREVMTEHVSEDVDVIVTDESILYASGLPKTQISKRRAVNHSADEYVRYENGFCVTTNTIESAFSLFKRGSVGTSHTLFLDTLRHMLTSPVLTFERLTVRAV